MIAPGSIWHTDGAQRDLFATAGPPIRDPRPVLLDLFCGGGGGARGYLRAGFRVVGVDLVASPRYPGRVVVGDVLALDLSALAREVGAVAVHASPPCQRYSRATREDDRPGRPDLFAPVGAALEALGLPACVENVPSAPWRDLGPSWSRVTVCGSSWGLPIHRHRTLAFFRAPLPPVPVCAHPPTRPALILKRHRSGADLGPLTLAQGRATFGLPLDARLTGAELGESIPPVYAHVAGLALLAALAVPAPDLSPGPPSSRALCACGCGAPVFSPRTLGRPRLYASDACKRRAWKSKGSK